MEKDISWKWKGENKACVAILTFDKVDFKTKVIVRDKEWQYIIIKGIIQQEYITLVNVYAPNTGVPNYIKHILMDIKGDQQKHSHSWGF